MNENTSIAACTQRHYEIRNADLPLSCPMPEMLSWNAHPRVYLDIETKGEVLCPYCGTQYVLVDSP